MKNIIILILATTFFTSLLHAIEPQDVMQIENPKQLKQIIKENDKKTDFQSLFLVGLAYHNLAKNDNSLDLDNNAINYLTNANNAYKSKNNQDNPLVLVYIGSALTLMGRDGKKIADKVAGVNNGLAYIDKAVELDNKNITIRIVRVLNNLELPKMFNRNSKIREDLDYIYSINKNNQHTDLLQSAYFKLAKLETNKEIQKQDYEKAYKLNPNTKIGLESKKYVN